MFGERLAELRKLNDDTQQILADKIGCPCMGAGKELAAK